jgi:hypothetical protein
MGCESSLPADFCRRKRFKWLKKNEPGRVRRYQRDAYHVVKIGVHLGFQIRYRPAAMAPGSGFSRRGYRAFPSRVGPLALTCKIGISL